MNIRTQRLCFITAILLLIATTATAENNEARGNPYFDISLSETTTDLAQIKDENDEQEAALRVFSALNYDIKQSLEQIKHSIPEFGTDQKLRLPDEVIKDLIPSGKEYGRLTKVVSPLFNYLRVVNRIVPILYRSDYPVVCIVPDGNAIIFSTGALDALSDDEIEALTAHEITHLAVQKSFKAAKKKKSEKALRIIELFCDAGAALLVQNLGREPKALNTGLCKLRKILFETYSEPEKKGVHPTNEVRVNFLKRLADTFKFEGQKAETAARVTTK